MLFEVGDLIVRPFKMSDLDALFKLQNDPKVTKYLSYDSWSYERCKENLEDWLDHYNKDLNLKVVGIVKKEEDRLIGIVGWIFSDDKKDAELAIRLNSEEWGKGYGTKLLLKIRDYAFEHFNVNNIYGITHKDNVGMRSIFSKSGFNQQVTKEKDEAVFFKLTKYDYSKLNETQTLDNHNIIKAK